MNPATYHYNDKGIDLDGMIIVIKLFVEQVFKLLFKVLFKLILKLLFRLVLIEIVELAMVVHIPTGEPARAKRGAFKYNHVAPYPYLNVDSIDCTYCI